MFNIRFWQFDKRENSTKRPDHTQGIVIPCALKDNCSAINPVFEINTVLWPDGNPTGYNYCLCPTFGRYYFIRDWSYERGLWIAHLEVDVLASYRDQIAASEQYVVRSSAQYTPYIVDTRYATTNEPSRAASTAPAMWVQGIALGTYIIGVINSDSAGLGAVHYYMFDQTSFNNFTSQLLSSADWLDISDISQNLQKALFNPMQYIVSCMWVPIALSSIITEADIKLTSIKLGWWSFAAECYSIPSQPTIVGLTNLSVPKHPQAEDRGTYLNGPPYSSYQFTFPGFGNFSLDALKLCTLETVYCVTRVDLITGLGVLMVHDGQTNPQSGRLITTVRGQIGVPIQMAQLSSNPLNNIGGILGSVATAATGIFGGIVGGLQAIGTSANFLSPEVETRGTNGSFAETLLYPRIDATFLRLVEEDLADIGRPLCAVKEIAQVPGYIVVEDADVSLVATAEENRRVKQYMETGFFYE